MPPKSRGIAWDVSNDKKREYNPVAQSWYYKIFYAWLYYGHGQIELSIHKKLPFPNEWQFVGHFGVVNMVKKELGPKIGLPLVYFIYLCIHVNFRGCGMSDRTIHRFELSHQCSVLRLTKANQLGIVPAPLPVTLWLRVGLVRHRTCSSQKDCCNIVA